MSTKARSDAMSDEVAARILGISRRTLVRWVQARRVPAPLTTNGRTRGWTLASIEAIKAAIEGETLEKEAIAAGTVEPARRSGKDNKRRYAGALLRGNRQEGIVA